MSEYAPMFNTRITKPDQACLRHAALRHEPSLQTGTWGREVLREAAVKEIAVMTLKTIDKVADDGMEKVIAALNLLSAEHSGKATTDTENSLGQTLSNIVLQSRVRA